MYIDTVCINTLSRIFANVNLLSLILSAPFVGCEDEGRACNELFVWFTVITCIDLVVAVVYSLQAIARVEYAVYLWVQRNRQAPGVSLWSVISLLSSLFFSVYSHSILKCYTILDLIGSFDTFCVTH